MAVCIASSIVRRARPDCRCATPLACPYGGLAHTLAASPGDVGLARSDGIAVARPRGGVVAWWRGGVVAWWRGGVVAWWRGGVVAWWRGGVVAVTVGMVAGSAAQEAVSLLYLSWSVVHSAAGMSLRLPR